MADSMSGFDPRRMKLSPPHLKKVIYVDQFGISDMMKAVDAKARGHKRVDPFWLRLFEALERVCKLQLAVCPSSPIHREESLLAESFTALERMYEQLSNGVKFQAPDEIEQRQTDAALVAWLDGREPEHPLDPERVTHGGLHDWQGQYIVTVSMQNIDHRVPALRRARRRLSSSLAQWFEDCRGRSDQTFDHAMQIESDGCRDGLIEAYSDWSNRQVGLSTGRIPFTPENISPSPAAYQMIGILEVLKRRGAEPTRARRIVIDFLNSQHFRDTPTNRISTRLFASIAHAAANGRKQPPDNGTSNDIRMVSAYLPYCDAMLVDNRVRAMLKSLPKRYALHYLCRVFSRSNGDEFLSYLRDLEHDADPLVLALVRDVYGPQWPKPFLEMYEVERRLGKNV
jgi:hypothetical protein